VAEAAQAADDRQRDAHHRASRRRARRHAGVAQSRPRSARVADDAESRRIGRQRHRSRALRRCRPDSHRGAARRRPVLRNRSTVFHHRDRLRILETPRRSAREVGQGDRSPRRGRDRTDGSSLRPDRALPGQSARRPRQPPDGRVDHAGRVQGRRRSEHVSRADRAGAPAVAAVEAVHGWSSRERGLDDSSGHGPIQPVARRLVQQLLAHRSLVPAIAEQRPAHANPRTRLRLLQAARGCRPGTRQGDELLRRHRGARRRRRRRSSARSSRRWPRPSRRTGSPIQRPASRRSRED
jgi:hypothetical protein